MTIEEIKNSIIEIFNDDGEDYESAHRMEDKLYRDFIEYIASGGKDEIIRKANMILSTQDMNFPRYYS